MIVQYVVFAQASRLENGLKMVWTFVGSKIALRP